jgi:teichuronic acid biosynthesis glycosyltransferase TuaG
VLSQTYGNFEIIIVDDCSTDNSVAIVKSLIAQDKRIKLIESEENFGGPARPRNTGVENAKGDYLAFLDADDLWTANKLEDHIAFMQANNLDFSSTNLQPIDEDNNHTFIGNKLSFYTKKKSRKEKMEDLIKENFIATSSVVLKKKIFNPFNEDKEMVAVEDFCLWLRLFEKEDVKYGYMDKKLLKYRIIESSISERGVSYKQEVKALICILRFMLENGKYEYVYPFAKRVFKKIYLRKILK